jgi:hypothetical protein
VKTYWLKDPNNLLRLNQRDAETNHKYTKVGKHMKESIRDIKENSKDIKESYRDK